MTTTPSDPPTALPGRPPIVDLAAWHAARDELLVVVRYAPRFLLELMVALYVCLLDVKQREAVTLAAALPSVVPRGVLRLLARDQSTIFVHCRTDHNRQ